MGLGDSFLEALLSGLSTSRKTLKRSWPPGLYPSSQEVCFRVDLEDVSVGQGSGGKKGARSGGEGEWGEAGYSGCEQGSLLGP